MLCLSSFFCTLFLRFLKRVYSYMGKYFPASIYLFKVNNKSSRKKWEIYSKLTLKSPERPHWHPPFIVDFELVYIYWVVKLCIYSKYWRLWNVKSCIRRKSEKSGVCWSIHLFQMFELKKIILNINFQFLMT